MAGVSSSWRLERYARYITTNKSAVTGEWKYYKDSSTGQLVMTLTDTDYLVVCQGPTVLESHSLVTARAWMRGLSKTDSFLFMYKIKDGTRRFRVKFRASDTESASAICENASRKLSKFFPVKLTHLSPAQNADKNTVADESDKGADSSRTLNGEITIGHLAQVVLGESCDRLPVNYRAETSRDAICGMTSVSDEVIADHLRIFLTDPSFPAFVEQVDKQIQSIIKECRD